MLDPLQRLVQRVEPQGRLAGASRLAGGVSAQVYAVEVELPAGLARRLVVRLHGERDLARNPQIAAHEFELLKILSDAGLPVPTPVCVGGAGEFYPAPCLVTEFIEGETDFSPADLDTCVEELATALARIHAMDPSSLRFLPRKSPQQMRALESCSGLPAMEAGAAARLRAASPLPGSWGVDRLLHGDYWPGNVLWSDRKLVGIIDWEDAGLGDPLADVGNARLEILWAFGHAAMERFTRHYLDAGGLDGREAGSRLPYWDLCSALEKGQAMAGWGLARDKEMEMRRLRENFIARALERVKRNQQTPG